MLVSYTSCKVRKTVTMSETHTHGDRTLHSVPLFQVDYVCSNWKYLLALSKMVTSPNYLLTYSKCKNVPTTTYNVLILLTTLYTKT